MSPLACLRWQTHLSPLSQLLVSKLVCEEMLALFSREYKLRNRLRAGPYQLASLLDNPRIQCDVFEAYVGAIHLEHGYTKVREWLRELFGPILEGEYEALREKLTRQTEVKSGVRDLSVQVQAFNEKCQVRRLTPTCEFREEGPPHKRVFGCTVRCEAYVTEGEGPSKKVAKHDALAKMAANYQD